MRLSGTLLIAVGTVTAAYGWACLVKFIPNTLLSLYRYKLWRLRDALHEDLRVGLLPRVQPSEKLLATLEGSIRRAEELSFLNLATTGFFARMTPTSLQEMVDTRCLLENLEEDQKKRLEAYESAYYRASLIRIFLGTPSGWLGLLTVPVWAPVFYLRDKKTARPDPHQAELIAEYERLFGYKDTSKERFVQRVSQTIRVSPDEVPASSSAYAA